MVIHTPRKNAGTRIFVGSVPGAAPAVEIGGVTDLGELGNTRNSIDVTTLADTARRRIKGLIDAGEQRISGNFDSEDAGQKILNNAVGWDAALLFKVEILYGQTKYVITYAAHVTSFQPASGTIDGVLQFTATLTVDGKRTYETVAA